MRWDKEIENKLRDYPRKLNAINNLKQKINYLNSCIYTLKGSFRDTDPVQDGSCKQEDILLSKIVEREELERILRDVEHDVKWIQKGLTCLDEIEFKVIQKMYLSEFRIKMDVISKSLGYSIAQVYRIKDGAVEKMTLELYGKLYS